ncbi:hypothetical protein GGR57DRAFT_467599 [Xylariaceae sp. FL1272]|nr:hypothetical protein GGR57DRAFT_467599 [Xylariaceae sp. FL1272]
MTLAIALNKTPHVKIWVYEANSKISERGAALSLSTNALKELDQILSPRGRQQLLTNAAAVPLNSVHNIVGPNAGQVICDIPGGDEYGATVYRASLLRELWASLPSGLVQAGNRLKSINQSLGDAGKIGVVFDDRSSDLFHGVIDADGIFSSAQAHVLQGERERHTHKATHAGFWDSRFLVPIEVARARLGDDLFDSPRQCGRVGDGAFVMHDVSIVCHRGSEVWRQ